MRYDEDYVAGLKARISELEEALEEAVYLLNPTDEDMQKKAGVYRVVTAFEKLKEKDADEWYEKALWGDKLKEKNT